MLEEVRAFKDFRSAKDPLIFPARCRNSNGHLRFQGISDSKVRDHFSFFSIFSLSPFILFYHFDMDFGFDLSILLIWVLVLMVE